MKYVIFTISLVNRYVYLYVDKVKSAFANEDKWQLKAKKL